MSNRRLGNQFEKEFCELLYTEGWWVHNMAQNAHGQPADVIAVKRSRVELIDCKVCTNNRFPFSRIEPNQETAMEWWEEATGHSAYFALKIDEGTFMFPYAYMRLIQMHKLSLNKSDIINNGTPLSDWLNTTERSD